LASIGESQPHPPPLWLGCDLQETCQIRQLLDLGGHHSVFGGVMVAGRLGFIGTAAEAGRAAAGDVLADHFASTNQARGELGGAAALAGAALPGFDIGSAARDGMDVAQAYDLEG
jgi:hypothetical protein